MEHIHGMLLPIYLIFIRPHISEHFLLPPILGESKQISVKSKLIIVLYIILISFYLPTYIVGKTGSLRF
jgi:hypothetical protein